MENIIQYFNSISINFDTLWKSMLILLLGTLLLSLLGRFVFGKRSALTTAVSSAIGIIFIYGITVIVGSLGSEFDKLVAPLPFVSISGREMALFSFEGAHYTTVCSEILSMIILSFLVNLADDWLPKKTGFFAWLFFRFLTVVIGYLLHLIVVGLFATLLPEGLVIYAPTVLLGLLVVLLLTGILKLLVGAILSTVNPIIGGLYTFFFATAIGKRLSKAMLTTLLLALLVWGLGQVGLGVISFTSAALITYVPVLILLIALWYLVIKVF
ncbi:MAG: hypothetical protein IJZ56_06275 [Oscillospiraceae bacterium]|nr:hypothetical protein [Oscillospiraceae bacterium]